MTPRARSLFTDGPVEGKLDEARDTIEAAVQRLHPARLDAPSLAAQLAERAVPRPPQLDGPIRYRLFEAELADPAHPAARRRWGAGVEAAVSFRGSADFFTLRAGSQPLRAPKAVIKPRTLILTAADPDCDAAELIERLDDQLETIRRELEEQRRRCDAMRDNLEVAARKSIKARSRRIASLTQGNEVLAARGWLPRGR